MRKDVTPAGGAGAGSAFGDWPWLREVLATAHEAFVSMDADGVIQEWNPAAERIFGWTRDEAVGRPTADLIVPERHRAAHWRGLQRYLETGEGPVLGRRIELPGLRKDGTEVDLELTIAPLVWQGATVFNAFLHDITDRKRREEELRRQRYQLEESQRLAHIGSWEWSVAENRVAWSDELFRIYGLERGAFDGSFEGYLERVHPDDREGVKASLAAALAEGEDFEFEERIVRPEGEVRVLLSRGLVERDERGAPLRLVGTCLDVTRQRAAMREVEQIKRRLQLLLDSVEEGIYGVDLDGTASFVNHAAAVMLGWAPRELVGAPQHEVVHHTRKDGSRYPEPECPIHRTCRDGRRRRVDDEVFWRRDGTSFPVSYTTTAIREEDGSLLGAVVSFRDLSRQQETEREAQRALQELVSAQAARAEAESMRSRLRRIFEQVPALVILLRGPEHVVEMINPAARELLGGREVLDLALREALPELAAQGFAEILDRVYATGEAYVGHEVPLTVGRGDGRGPVEGFFDFVYQPLVEPDGVVSDILIHAMEVTEQVESRRELEHRAEELTRLTSRLERSNLDLARSNRDLDQFAYVASHDLKAPLRGIVSLSSWIAEDLGDELPETVDRHVALLQNRAARMEALIEGLLQYSRAGRVRKAAEEVELPSLVAEVVELLGLPDGLQLAVGGSPDRLRAEALPLRQVLQNLLANAARYARQRVGVGWEERDGALELRVEDDGPGIAPEYHARIFTMFQTLESRDQGGGTGIGLAIVQKLVHDQGGEVWVDSQPGAGATFRFTWPLRPADGEVEAEDEAASPR